MSASFTQTTAATACFCTHRDLILHAIQQLTLLTLLLGDQFYRNQYGADFPKPHETHHEIGTDPLAIDLGKRRNKLIGRDAMAQFASPLNFNAFVRSSISIFQFRLSSANGIVHKYLTEMAVALQYSSLELFLLCRYNSTPLTSAFCFISEATSLITKKSYAIIHSIYL